MLSSEFYYIFKFSKIEDFRLLMHKISNLDLTKKVESEEASLTVELEITNIEPIIIIDDLLGDFDFSDIEMTLFCCFNYEVDNLAHNMPVEVMKIYREIGGAMRLSSNFI